jgi:uncharacterized RDD family membrane protein YckC
VSPRPACAGLVTRALAFGIDAAIINAAALIVAAVVALTFSVIDLPGWLRAFAVAVGAFVYALWLVGYFTMFWTTTGQTPGDRMMRICVRTRDGSRMKPRRAVLRFVSLTLAALPLFAGFLMILVDRDRRGLHDWIARTVVTDETGTVVPHL